MMAEPVHVRHRSSRSVKRRVKINIPRCESVTHERELEHIDRVIEFSKDAVFSVLRRPMEDLRHCFNGHQYHD